MRPGTELDAITTLRSDPAVEFIEPDYLIFAAQMATATIPDDFLFAQQWGLAKIKGPTAWLIASGSDVTIAVIDSGVDLDHPELTARIVSGYDFVNNDATPDDDNGHGTQVAGVAAAAANNGRGIAGLAWNARIMPLKVLDKSGKGLSSALTCAIYWAAEHGAQVINMSIVTRGLSFGMQAAINHATSEGVAVFAAAGNLFKEGNPVTYPAAHSGVIAVAATDRDDTHAWFSSTGSYVDIAAPGVGIYSPFPPSHEEYRSVHGTSLATPYGAGLAALILSAAPGLSPGHVETIIRDSAVDLGDPGRDDVFGYGRIDAAAATFLALSSLPWQFFLPAVQSPLPTPTVTPSPTPSPIPTVTPTPTPTPTPTQESGGERS